MKISWRQTMGLLGLVALMAIVVGCQQTRQTRPTKPVKGLQSIHFDTDRSNIKSEYRAVMNNNAAWLKQHSRTKIVIEGNCDERGSVEYNIALGWRRARSGKNYLVSSGISASRVTTKSYGKERPVCTQSTESCWWKNRRDDFAKK